MKDLDFYRPPVIDVFGIHHRPAFVYSLDGNTYTSSKPSVPKNYLPNQDKINISGKVLEKGTEKQYIASFVTLLSAYKAIEVEDYLDFHYTASINKERYLKLVRAFCYSDWHHYPGKQQLALQWLDRMVNQNTNTISYKQSKEMVENSFRYNSPSQKDCLESWLGALSKARLISGKIKPTEFKKIFNEVPISKITPLDWQGSIASLKYFIKSLKFKMLEVEKIEVATYCFLHKGKNLKSSQIKNAKQISNKDKQIIDKIFKDYPFIK